MPARNAFTTLLNFKRSAGRCDAVLLDRENVLVNHSRTSAGTASGFISLNSSSVSRPSRLRRLLDNWDENIVEEAMSEC